MNWQRATQREDAARIRRESVVGLDVSFRAKFATVCVTCREPIEVGDRIASLLRDQKREYSHATCIYGRGREQSSEPRTLGTPTPTGVCQATTKKGDPCRGGAKKGELYCGPHLAQQNRDSSGPRRSTVDPYDEPF